MGNIHICFVAVHIYPVLIKGSGIAFVGGSEVQQTVQIRALQRAGYKVSIVTSDYGQSDVVEFEGIPIYKIQNSSTRGIPGTRFFYPRMTDLLSILRRISPDIVYVQTAGEQVTAAAVYARMFNKRFVFAGASDPEFERGQLAGMARRHTAMYRLGLKLAHAIIVQNSAQLRLLKSNFGRDGYLIPNGYEESGARPGAFEGPVLWAATVKPLKRPEIFLDLARSMPEREFVMVGGPSIASNAAFCAKIMDSAASIPNLRTTGHIPFSDVGTYFDGASVFVNTSEYEGLPNTFMQAWLRGIPTVSFVRPESSPGESGTQVCGDVEDMRRKLCLLTRQRVQWDIASAASRRCFNSHHAIGAAVERYRRLFSSVMAG